MPRISAIAYQVERLPGWTAVETKLDPLLAGCDLALLPEYAGLEAGLLAADPEGSPLDWRDRAAERAAEWEAQLAQMAQKHGCWLTGASLPVRTERGVVNRGYFVAPWGEVHHQDKLILTPYEREVMQLVPGEGLTLVDTVMGRFGMLICYDAEFPLLARALAEADADMILVPSATDLPAGQTRVRQSARARAIENQLLVVQAPLVGRVQGCDIVDQSTGRAGFFVPPDTGLPEDGILGQGTPDAHGALTLEVDFAATSGARSTGQVGNYSHWPEQADRNTQVRVLAL